MGSKHKLDFIDSELKKIKADSLYRKLRNGRVQGPYITINGKKLINLCSNDYLGIPPTKITLNQLQSSSRLVSGNDEDYIKLEEWLAKHKSQQKSLIFPTGYMANIGTIASVVSKGDIIFSDELNHASIIEASKLSGGKISVYAHNDMNDLEKKIKSNKSIKRKFIITEGIFSMDGDFSNLKQIAEISEKEGAVTVVDDAHGDFVVGKDGKGTADYFNVAKKIDLYISSLSKGLGSFGGYVASQKNVIDFFINKSKSFIYTSALPSIIVRHALKRLDCNRNEQVGKLERNTIRLTRGLQEIGYSVNSPTHIIPVIVGDEKKALSLGKFLLDNGVFAQPIRYPTVAKNKARLRISVTAWLSPKDINKALDIFKMAYDRFYK